MENQQQNAGFYQMDASQWAMDHSQQACEQQPFDDETFQRILEDLAFEDQTNDQTGDIYNSRQGHEVQPTADQQNVQLLDMQRHQLELQNLQLQADVENLRRLLGQENPDENMEHIGSWDELHRLERAERRLAVPAPDPSLAADFPPESQHPALARRLVVAMNNLAGIEDRATLPSGADSAAVKCLKVKKPVEKQMRAWKLVRSIHSAQCGMLSLPPKYAVAEYNSYMGRFAAVEEALRLNKLLVRSCFETEAWVERIAANPDGERRVKLDNEAGNTSQHGKLKFFTEAKRKNPNLDPQNFPGASSSSAVPQVNKRRRTRAPQPAKTLTAQESVPPPDRAVAQTFLQQPNNGYMDPLRRACSPGQVEMQPQVPIQPQVPVQHQGDGQDMVINTMPQPQAGSYLHRAYLPLSATNGYLGTHYQPQSLQQATNTDLNNGTSSGVTNSPGSDLVGAAPGQHIPGPSQESSSAESWGGIEGHMPSGD